MSSNPPALATAHPGPALSALLIRLQELGYTSAAAEESLGPMGLAAAHGANPAGALHALSQQKTNNQELISAIYLRQPHPLPWWQAIFGENLVGQLISARLLDGQTGTLCIDIRPLHLPFHGSEEVLVSSDPDASMERYQPGPHHVPGVGRAPLSLLRSIPPLPADTACDVLDLGTGSGALSLFLAANYPQARVTGTDIHARALDFARANDVDCRVEWLQGSWFDPVADRQFDRIVSNPPFVIGPAVDLSTGGHVYRDSGLALDNASRIVVDGAAAHLAESGQAHLLVGWALTDESAPPAPVQWVPDSGIRALLVQRDVVDVYTYVQAWVEDESIDPRSTQGQARIREWLEFFAKHGVTHIGMGFMHLERSAELVDMPSEVHVEVIDQPLSQDTHLGLEVAEWFRRMTWLAKLPGSDAILDHCFAVRPGVAVEEVFVGDATAGQGFTPHARILSRTEGPCYRHDIDAHVQSIVAGLHPEGLTMRDVVELYATVQGIDHEACAQAFAPLAVDLVRHGIIIPTEVLS